MPNEKMLESLRSRYEATLNVLMARIASAQDGDDWATIEIQTRELHRIAKHARRAADGFININEEDM
jgi:hypothetical protein